MRYLGIDYGSKRMGIARSDEEGRIAFPLSVVRRTSRRQVIREIQKIVRTQNISAVIVGLPLGLDGKDTAQTQDARSFGENLMRLLDMPVVYENEMLTTRMARASGADKEHVDESSAALILQSYLDKKK